MRQVEEIVLRAIPRVVECYQHLQVFVAPDLEIHPAPKARNMKARGKREARRPWVYAVRVIRPEGPKYKTVLRPFRAA